jgi:hypothetical protein
MHRVWSPAILRLTTGGGGGAIDRPPAWRLIFHISVQRIITPVGWGISRVLFSAAGWSSSLSLSVLYIQGGGGVEALGWTSSASYVKAPFSCALFATNLQTDGSSRYQSSPPHTAMLDRCQSAYVVGYMLNLSIPSL